MRLTIFRPSSREITELLPPALQQLQAAGFQVEYRDVAPNKDWLYSAGTAKDRAQVLNELLLSEDSDIVVAARGGYGASDLLPYLAWESLRRTAPKWVSGFSDVSALHSALYTKLGWRGVHGPMPATQLWGTGPDVSQLLDLWRHLIQRQSYQGSLALTPIGEEHPAELSGELFGGCFSVLTNLIGTPYIPKSLTGKILFFEDIGEHPGRLIRAWNQWLQSGLTEGVRAVVMGHLKDLGPKIPDHADFVYQEFARRCDLPVYQCLSIGHTTPNYPLVVGAMATIKASHLEWQLPFVPSSEELSEAT